MSREHIVRLIKHDDGQSKSSVLEISKVVVSILATIAVPVIIFIVGSQIESKIEDKSIEAKYLEIASAILREPPSPETKNLRQWAIDNIKEYSDIAINEDVERELKTETLPQIRSNNHDTKNFQIPEGEREIEFIILTDTETGSLAGIRRAMNSPNAQVSYHYVVGVDGTVEQFVDEAHIAWHAGASAWQGKRNLNKISIGIGLVHLSSTDGDNWLGLSDTHPAVGPDYPNQQLDALINLLVELLKRHSLDADSIITKQDVAPNRRRTDLFGDGVNEVRAKVTLQMTE